MNVGEWAIATLKEHPQEVLSFPSTHPPSSPPTPTQSLPPPPLPLFQRILSVGTPTHLPLGENNPTQARSLKVLQPKERMT